MRVALGIDPGQRAGVALVGRVRGQLPQLLGCWPIWGADDAEWAERAQQALLLASRSAAAHQLAGVWIEYPPPIPGKGWQSYFEAGRRIGLIEHALHQRRLSRMPVQPLDWQRLVGVRGKARDGGIAGRVAQVERLLPGSLSLIEIQPCGCGLDIIEAALIALALLIRVEAAERQPPLLPPPPRAA